MNKSNTRNMNKSNTNEIKIIKRITVLISFFVSLVSIAYIFGISNIYKILCHWDKCIDPPVIVLVIFGVSSVIFLWSIIIMNKDIKFPFKFLSILILMSILSYYLLPSYQDYIIPESKIVLLILNITAPIVYLLQSYFFKRKN